MIQVVGTKQREFIFPGNPQTALTFYNDFSRLTTFLPHITLTTQATPDQVRMRYHTRELGAYQVTIFADLQTRTNHDPADNTRVLWVEQATNFDPVASHSGFNTTTAHGRFQSESRFYPHGNQTRIDYTIHLQAELPSPVGLRFVPQGLLNRIAQSIAQGRMEEIINGFIQHSIGAFPAWLAQNEEK